MTETVTDYERVRDALRLDIVKGTLAPGDRLKIQTMMARYQVGSNPVREAIQQLQGEGMVVVSPNKGASVRQLDERFIRDAMEVRFALDTYFALRFVEIGSYQVLDELQSIQDNLEQALSQNDVDTAIEENILFHRRVIEAAGNNEASRTFERYSIVTRTIRRLIGYSAQRSKTVPKEHRQLIAAFKRRDGTAAMMIARNHAVSAGEELIELYLKMRSNTAA